MGVPLEAVSSAEVYCICWLGNKLKARSLSSAGIRQQCLLKFVVDASVSRVSPMDSPNILCLVLLGLLGFPFSARGENCTNNILIFENGTEVHASDCTFYLTGSCKNGADSLPNGLNNGSSVDKPRNFTTEVYVDYNYTLNGQGYIVPGIIFRWNVPLSALSRQNTRGYWLELKEVQSANVMCRVIDLSRYDLHLTSHFQLKLFPISKPSPVSYLVQLYSLPPPSQEEMTQGLYERVIVNLPKAIVKNENILPDQWTTWINIERNPEGNSVTVKFGLGKDPFVFDQYKVRLYSYNDSRNDADTMVYQTPSMTIGQYTFPDVPAGIYNVSVRPDDRYYQETDKCQCFNGYAYYGRSCTSCTTSWSSSFDVKGGLPMSTASSSKPEPTTPPAPYAFTGLIVGAVLGGIFIVAILVLLGFWLCAQRKKQDKYFTSDGSSKKNLGPAMPLTFPETDFKPKDPPAIRLRKVFLLAADDHEYHTQAVERFADFLRVHCQVIVSFAPQCLSEIRAQNAYCWLAAKIEDSDNVLIVVSKGANCLYQAFQKGLTYRREDFGPEGDLFTPGIQHICGMIARNVDVSKILTVHFEYTPSDCCLPIAALPSSMYLLPKHLSSLVQQIHKLNVRNEDLAKVNLPLRCNVTELKEGSQWIDAVQNAKVFEKQHVNWFCEKFEASEEYLKSNPPYLSQESGFYSDVGSIHSRNSTGSLQQLSAESFFQDVFVSDMSDFTKDDFIEPSVYSVYTIIPAHGYNQDEVDDRASCLSEQMKKINQRYENFLQEEQTHCLRTAETESIMHQQMHLLNAINEAAWGQGMDNLYDEADSVSVISAQSV